MQPVHILYNVGLDDTTYTLVTTFHTKIECCARLLYVQQSTDGVDCSVSDFSGFCVYFAKKHHSTFILL